jgi:hypothetical protein
MSDTNNPTQNTRIAILAELQSLTSMARGTLREEFREHPAPEGGGTVRLGPYYKHQCWENGRNASTRIPAACVDMLREQLHNGKRFEQLTDELAALAVAEGAAQRDALAYKPTATNALAAKKNSRKNASKNATKKPKPTSMRSSPNSRHRA